MSMVGNIAGMATGMSNAQLQYNVSLSVTKKAMDSQEVALQGLLEMMPQNPAGIGQNIDTYA
ncbi:MAG TPA: YjfB family protein [Candidatus Butyricicoccus avistercoris]|uniref:YjfB family protein n=1 Tax=Candidatus Butyricicoccus avistercoris TaxID=2838518 RepID=A0A9D1TH65_9FIRM|nr:YjfB family protein [Candidatus Butyricicoccus avistercoris]